MHSSSNVITMMHLLVVGAGSAGSVLANRLTEDCSSVLLVEAGGSEQDNALISTPIMWELLLRTGVDWQYVSVPQTTSTLAGIEEVSLYNIAQWRTERHLYRKQHAIYTSIQSRAYHEQNEMVYMCSSPLK